MERIVDEAAYVFQIMNAEYWRVLLAALDAVAVSNGYAFEKGGESVELTYELKHRFGDEVVRAKLRYLTPSMSPENLEKRVKWDCEDGYTLALLEQLFQALRQRGFALKGRALESVSAEQSSSTPTIPAWELVC